MATVGATYLTLADLFKRKDPNHQIAQVIEMLREINPILEDAIVRECNNGTKHLTTVRTGLPDVTWRLLYQGVNPGKSTTRQVEDTTGMMEAWSEVDSKLVELSGDSAGLRLSEATAFVEAMNQEMATGMFYHDTRTTPEKFLGLAPRFSSLGAENGSQIVDAGGTGSDNTSIWFVVWGDTTCHLIYPKASQAGLMREDKGKTTKELSDGSMYDVHREKFSWSVGLSLRDWRYVSRVANIDSSDLTVDAATGANLFQNMITAYYKLRQRRVSGGRAAIYCNTRIKEFLHQQALAASGAASFLRLKEAREGEEVMTFLGLPVRECDAILNTEARVV